MDFPEFNTGDPSPPRREIQIQGPRPAPLKVRKDSYKIRKPPLAPMQPSMPPAPPQPPQPQGPQQPRRPVIIYTVSPKVIHTTASDFMTLVQRLTGPNSSSSYTNTVSSSSSSPPSSFYVDNSATVLVSPAARFATIEKANTPSQGEKSRKGSGVDVVEGINDIGGGSTTVERTCLFPGILSPVPSSLPPISPHFFSPTTDPNSSLAFLLSPAPSSLPPNSPHLFSSAPDPNSSLAFLLSPPVSSSFPPNFFSPTPDRNSSLAFLQDLSPIFNGNRNFIEGTYVPSPSAFLSSAPLTSPTPFMDLFNQFDL